MGFLDKIKRFVGGHGVTVEITEVDGSAPNEASIPVDAWELHGVLCVRAEKDAEILSHTVELLLEHSDSPEDPDDPGEEIRLVRETRTAEAGAPYKVTGGDQVEDRFHLSPINIASALDELGLDVEQAAHSGEVRLVLRVVVDVKGSPVDPKAEASIELAPPRGGVHADDDETDEPGEVLGEIPVRTKPLPLDPRPWKERFEAMVAELRAHPRIEIEELEIGPPAEPDVLDRIAKEYPLPNVLRDFYSQMNGFHLTWQLKDADEDEGEMGLIRILPVEEVYGPCEFREWVEAMDDDELEEEDKIVKELYPFDAFIEEAHVGLRLDGDPNPKVYYHYHGEEVLPLEVDAAGYLELLLASRGFRYWCAAVAHDVEGEEGDGDDRLFRTMMPKLFPDFDPSFFFRRSYKDVDEAAVADRQERMMALREELTRLGADFELVEGDGSFIEITVSPSAKNMEKVAKAVAKVVGYEVPLPEPGEEWGMLQIGDILIEART